MLEEGEFIRIANRIADLVREPGLEQLGGPSVWRTMARQLQQEVSELKDRYQLTDRDIRNGLTRLSVDEVIALFEELRAVDPNAPNTIVTRAFRYGYASKPIVIADFRRYLKKYQASLMQTTTKSRSRKEQVDLEELQRLAQQDLTQAEIGKRLTPEISQAEVSLLLKAHPEIPYTSKKRGLSVRASAVHGSPQGWWFQG